MSCGRVRSGGTSRTPARLVDTPRPPAQSARGAPPARRCHHRSCGRHPAGRRVSLFRRSTCSPVKRATTRSTPRPARTGSSDSSSGPVATTRTARSATASFTPGIRRMASSSSSCLRGTGQLPGELQDPLGPTAALEPFPDLAKLRLRRQRVGRSLPAGHQRPQRPDLLHGKALQQDLSGDHLPAAPRPEPRHRPVRQGIEPPSEQAGDLLR